MRGLSRSRGTEEGSAPDNPAPARVAGQYLKLDHQPGQVTGTAIENGGRGRRVKYQRQSAGAAGSGCRVRIGVRESSSWPITAAGSNASDLQGV